MWAKHFIKMTILFLVFTFVQSYWPYEPSHGTSSDENIRSDIWRNSIISHVWGALLGSSIGSYPND